MKNTEKVSAIVFSIMFLFFSCSTEINNQVVTGEDNLKAIAAQKEKTVQWTQELEKNRLSQKIDSEFIKESHSVSFARLLQKLFIREIIFASTSDISRLAKPSSSG